MVKIVGFGGTITEGSSAEMALALALRSARNAGAETEMFATASLVAMPHYGTQPLESLEKVKQFISAIRSADGLIISSPGYHGTISGLVKNAIDYLQEMAGDQRPYLDRIPVGLIATAYGWQATGSTLAALRTVVHALRGMPTPFGACVRSRTGLFSDGECTDTATCDQLALVGEQVVELAMLRTKGSQVAVLTPY